MTKRVVVRSVAVRSAFRVGVALSLAVWAIGFVGFVALYLLGLVSGGLGGVEGFIASLGFTGFRLSILPFLVVFVVVAGLASAVTGIVAGILAHLFNAVVPIVGGVDVVVDERLTATREQAPAPPVQRPLAQPQEVVQPSQWPHNVPRPPPPTAP